MVKTVEPQLYTPARVPKDTKDIPAYLDREFNRLARLLNNNPGLQGLFTERATAPSKVSDGMFVLADGTHWDPVGTGKWFVYYDSSSNSWKALNAATEIKYTNGSGLSVEDLFITAVTANQVTADSIAAGSITTSKLAAGAVTAATIAAGTITATQIAANTITASNLNITTLSAITANMGTLTAGKIQDATGKYTIDLGALLETIKDPSGTSRVLIGNYTGTDYGIQVYSATGALIFDSIVGLYGAGVSPDISTSQITDGAGLGNSAVWPIDQLPFTVAGYGIVDAMIDPGTVSSDGMVLQGMLDGTRSWRTQYGTEINAGVINPTSVDQTCTGSFAQFGNVITLPNPGQTVYLEVEGNCNMYESGTPGDQGQLRVNISIDGGTTYSLQTQPAAVRLDTASHGMPTGPSMYAGLVTPTGDIKLKLEVLGSAGTIHAQTAFASIRFLMLPSSANNYNTGPLTASLPSAAAATCNGYYPTTTCTTVKTLTSTISGGVPPYTYSNVVSAGTGSITSGATTQSFNISDTETTSDAGTTHTTTVYSTVTDSQSYTGVTFSNATGHNAVATISGGHFIAVGGIFNVSGASVSGYNITGGIATAVTATTVTYTIAGSGLGAGTGGTLNNVHVITGNCVFTGTFKRKYNPIVVTVSAIGGSTGCIAPVCGTCSATITGTATASISGGDGIYSKSWSVTAGGAVITSGSTSLTCHTSDTVTSGSPDSSTFKCSVTDGHSNTGNGSKSATFSANCFDGR